MVIDLSTMAWGGATGLFAAHIGQTIRKIEGKEELTKIDQNRLEKMLGYIDDIKRAAEHERISLKAMRKEGVLLGGLEANHYLNHLDDYRLTKEVFKSYSSNEEGIKIADKNKEEEYSEQFYCLFNSFLNKIRKSVDNLKENNASNLKPLQYLLKGMLCTAKLIHLTYSGGYGCIAGSESKIYPEIPKIEYKPEFL